MAQLGGYGNQIYNLIKDNLTISEAEYTLIWSKKIYPNKELREKYNGIWQKITLQDELLSGLIKTLSITNTAASYCARSTAIFLLLSCLDAIAGEKYQDFYSWLMNNYKIDNYSRKRLTELHEEYIQTCGGQQKFSELFELLVPLELVKNYEIYFHSKDILKLPHKDRSNVMNEVRDKYNSLSDKLKCRVIGRYYYNFYRNLFVHWGYNPSHDIPDWVIDKHGETRDKTFLIAYYPAIKLVSGAITGDIAIHLIQLVRLALAKNIERYK